MMDVLIIGNGPAGLASAITLRQQGASVMVVHRPADIHKFRVGESLAASARYSLSELEVWEEFLNDGHEPCYGNASCWGDDRLYFNDFIQSPSGQGWYVDRPAFESMLIRKAVAAGVPFHETDRSFRLHRKDNGWEYTGDQLKIDAAMVIDASGRNSWLSRQLGIRRIRRDEQVAVISILAAKDPLTHQQSLIEAVSDGWWYVSDIGEGKIARIFFTDPDLHDRNSWLDPQYWQNKSLHTKFIRHRVPASRYTEIVPLRYTSAGSHHLEHYAGEGWLAAGDAACSLDPLSSHGIAFALRSGIDAALAAKDQLTGISSAGKDYHEKIELAFRLYHEQRTGFYQREARWKDDLFWIRRHGEQLMEADEKKNLFSLNVNPKKNFD
jgi:flavin-dependent dehydrogenase